MKTILDMDLKYEDNLKYKDDLKYETDLKYEDYHNNEGDLKYEDDLIYMASNMKWTSIDQTKPNKQNQYKQNKASKTFQSDKIKAPKLNLSERFANPNHVSYSK